MLSILCPWSHLMQGPDPRKEGDIVPEHDQDIG